MKRLAAVLLIAVATAASLLSDLLIRAKGLDGTNGINARSYDVVASILIGIGVVTFLFGGDR